MVKPGPKRKQLGRVCAICGKRGGTTLGFSMALKRLGLPNWKDDKAHPECVRRLQERKS